MKRRKNKQISGIDLKLLKKLIEKFAKEDNPDDYLHEGDIVVFNMKFIEKDPNWEKMNASRKQFILDNQEKHLTVVFDPKYKTGLSVVCLKEDGHNPKWLWYVGELTKVKKTS